MLCWSARSRDGNTVILALWSDRFRWRDRPLTYDGSETDKDYLLTQPGACERLENLQWAKANCDGLFRVVMAKAQNERPRRIETCFPKPDWVMRITDLDEATGELQAVKTEET